MKLSNNLCVQWQFTKQNYGEGVPQSLRRIDGLEFWSQYGGEVIGGELNGSPIVEGDWVVVDNGTITIKSGVGETKTDRNLPKFTEVYFSIGMVFFVVAVVIAMILVNEIAGA